MKSPICVTTHSQCQHVPTIQCLLFICFAVFSPLSLLIMHDKVKTMYVSFDIQFIRLDQKHVGLASQDSPFLPCFWYSLINLIVKTLTWYSRHTPTCSVVNNSQICFKKKIVSPHFFVDSLATAPVADRAKHRPADLAFLGSIPAADRNSFNCK